MRGYIQALIDVNERELSRMRSATQPNNPVIKQQEYYIKQLNDMKEFYIQHETSVGAFKTILNIIGSESEENKNGR